MPKKHGKGNKINLPAYALTKDGRLPPPAFRISGPNINISKYTYKQLFDMAKLRNQKIDRKTPGRIAPKTKRG